MSFYCLLAEWFLRNWLWVILRIPDQEFIICNESLLPCCFQGSLLLAFDSLILMCLGLYPFVFIHFGPHWASWICEFVGFIKFGEVWAIIYLSIFFCPFLYYIFLWDSHIILCVILVLWNLLTVLWFRLLGRFSKMFHMHLKTVYILRLLGIVFSKYKLSLSWLIVLNFYVLLFFCLLACLEILNLCFFSDSIYFCLVYFEGLLLVEH